MAMKLVVNQDEAMLKTFQVIQRKDPDIVKIISKASHVWVMQYKEHLSQWDMSGIEGPLFLVQRQVQPEYRLLVLNKQRAFEHFMVDLTSTSVCVNHKPHLQYMADKTTTSPLWNLSFASEAAGLPQQVSAQFDTMYESIQQATRALTSDHVVPVQQSHTLEHNPTDRYPSASQLGTATHANDLDHFWDHPVQVTQQDANARIVRAAEESSPRPNPQAALDSMLTQLQQGNSSCQHQSQELPQYTKTPPAIRNTEHSPLPRPNAHMSNKPDEDRLQSFVAPHTQFQHMQLRSGEAAHTQSGGHSPPPNGASTPPFSQAGSPHLLTSLMTRQSPVQQHPVPGNCVPAPVPGGHSFPAPLPGNCFPGSRNDGEGDVLSQLFPGGRQPELPGGGGGTSDELRRDALKSALRNVLQSNMFVDALLDELRRGKFFSL